MWYIAFLDNVLSGVVSTHHFCRLDTVLHPGHRVQKCSYFLFENNNKKIQKYCQIATLNQTVDHAISIDKNFGNNHMNAKKIVYYLSYLVITV